MGQYAILRDKLVLLVICYIVLRMQPLDCDISLAVLDLVLSPSCDASYLTKGPVPYTNATQRSGRVVISWYMGPGATTIILRLICRVVRLEMFKINNPIVGTWGPVGICDTPL